MQNINANPNGAVQDRLSFDEKTRTAELQGYLRRISQETADIPLIAIDGIYGPETRDAVAAFQEVYGLPVTGTVDNRTWYAIVDEFLHIEGSRAPVATIRGFRDDMAIFTVGSRGETVALVQLMLNVIASRYSNFSPIPSDGRYDERTSAAVGRFQQLSRLPVTGDVDKRTWNAIVNHYNTLR